LLGIISGNRYSQALNPLLSGKEIVRNNLREQILTGYPLLSGKEIVRNNLREQILTGS
jgi:hypothetical protein